MNVLRTVLFFDFGMTHGGYTFIKLRHLGEG